MQEPSWLSITKTENFQWLKYFMTVKTFSVVWTDEEVPNPQQPLTEFDAPIPLRGAVRVANEWIKRQAVCVKGIRDFKWTLTWTWTAEEDDVLAWNSWLLDHES